MFTRCKKRWRVREKQKSISPGQKTNYSFFVKPRWILKASASFKEKDGNRKDLNMKIFWILCYDIMFYGLCENLWGGSPVISSLPNAIDIPLIRSAFVNKFPDDLSPVQLASFEDEEEEFEESVETSTSFKVIPNRIEKVSEMFKNCKDRK